MYCNETHKSWEYFDIILPMFLKSLMRFIFNKKHCLINWFRRGVWWQRPKLRISWMLTVLVPLIFSSVRLKYKILIHHFDKFNIFYILWQVSWLRRLQYSERHFLSWILSGGGRRWKWAALLSVVFVGDFQIGILETNGEVQHIKWSPQHQI